MYLNRIKSFAFVMTKFVREQTPCRCGRQGAITKVLIEHLLIYNFSNCLDYIYTQKNQITNKSKQVIWYLDKPWVRIWKMTLWAFLLDFGCRWPM